MKWSRLKTKTSISSSKPKYRSTMPIKNVNSFSLYWFYSEYKLMKNRKNHILLSPLSMKTILLYWLCWLSVGAVPTTVLFNIIGYLFNWAGHDIIAGVWENTLLSVLSGDFLSAKVVFVYGLNENNLKLFCYWKLWFWYDFYDGSGGSSNFTLFLLC